MQMSWLNGFRQHCRPYALEALDKSHEVVPLLEMREKNEDYNEKCSGAKKLFLRGETA